MKSRDILLLLKLISLQHHENQLNGIKNLSSQPELWQSRNMPEGEVLKQQGSITIKRCTDIGLAKKDRKYGVPRTNKKSLLEFIIYGIKYVFPARMGELTRGIATSFSAPMLNDKLFSSGELIPVWPDERAKSKGLNRDDVSILKIMPSNSDLSFTVNSDCDNIFFIAQ